MSTGTAVDVRRLDLSRAPDAQWNEEMTKMVANQLFRGRAVTKGELYYCLSIAEGIGLNPLINEIYFIPSKSRDGKGPSLQPYIGRNGLVAKAEERGAYYESDTVHANDKFTMRRRQDGTTVVMHSYGMEDRGEIVGAWAFLHFRNGDKPAFFYAKLSEYLPTFDEDWKMKASPWGNQRSAMIEKCAMIGAGRKRLRLGNVLMDGEVASYQEQGEHAGRPVAVQPSEFPFEQVTADPVLADRLRAAAVGAGWPAAKCEMVMSGRSADELVAIAEQMEAEAATIVAAERDASDAPGQSEAGAPDTTGGQDAAGSEAEDVTDAVVAPSAEEVQALRRRAELLEERMMAAPDGSDEQRELSDELDLVTTELEAAEDPNQPPLEGLGS